ncbi:MAG: hypothetical protein AB7F66_13475 [Bacteriovoracia bacterium]
MIQIQSRDRAMLRICYEQQFLTMPHIREFYPNNKSGKEAIRRAGALAKSGFWYKAPSPLNPKELIYRVTSRGKDIAQAEGAPKINGLKTLSMATLLHDGLVTAVRLRLGSIWNARFVCERAIKEGDYPQIPDGLFFFPSGLGIALEVENSEKGKTRFIELANRWAATPSVFAVLYVAKDQDLANTLKKFVGQASPTKPLGVVDWTSLRYGWPTVWTIRGELDWFQRREFP